MLSSFVGFISRVISLVSFSFPFSICFFDVFMCACLFVVLFHMRVFWLRFRSLIVLRQKHDHVACGGGKSTAELGLQETQKTHIFNTYAFPGAKGMQCGNTFAFHGHSFVFMRIHMRVPMFFWIHMPKAWMFCVEVNLGGNTF